MSDVERPVVTVFRADVPDWYPFPWRFRIMWRGVRHVYAGWPNACATKREAAARGAWRARWMLDGSYDRRYVSWPRVMWRR